MESFPVHINREACMTALAIHQEKLLSETRENFTKWIEKALENCARSVILPFDPRLWEEHRQTITNELIDRFGEFKTKTKQGGFEVYKMTNKGKLVKEITDIIIDF